MPSPPPPFKDVLRDIPMAGAIALMRSLDHFYPLQSPSLKDTDREVWFKSGQRDVVTALMRAFESAYGRSYHETTSNVHRHLGSQGPASPGGPSGPSGL